MACSDGLHCYEFLVSNVSILSFAHRKISDANFPPVVSPADLKCKFTSYNKNTPNISPQKSPVVLGLISGILRHQTATFKRVVLKPGNPETRKADRKSTHKSRYLAQPRLAVQTPVHGMVNSFDKISSTTCDANTSVIVHIPVWY